MFKLIPYEIFLNIVIFLSNKEDLYNLLTAINEINQYDKICDDICNYYTNKLEKYYILINSEEKIYYLYNLMEMKETGINADNIYLEDIFPTDKTNDYTLFCSNMILEYL